MPTNHNGRILTITERLEELKRKNTDKELSEFLELLEQTKENPSIQGVKALKGAKKSIQDYIDRMPADDNELIERLYYFVNFEAQKEADSSITKWDFFKETANRKEWTVVQKMIDIIEKNNDQHNALFFDANSKVDEKIVRAREENDKTDLIRLEKLLEEEVKPWAEENVTLYYQEMIERTMRTRMRMIQNRIKRNTDLAFAEWLRTTRKEKRMTLKEVADRSNTSPSYIQRMEKGKRKAPSLPIIKSIADALRVPHYEVLEVIDETAVGQEAVDLLDLIRQRKIAINGQEIDNQQRELLERLLITALNDNTKSEIQNLLNLPNIAVELKDSIERSSQEDMSDDTTPGDKAVNS